MLTSILKLANILSSIFPNLVPLAIFFSVYPFSLIEMSVRTGVLAIPMERVISPLSLIHIAIIIIERPIAVHLVVLPLPLEPTAVLPYLGPISVSHCVHPLTTVSYTDFQFNRLQFYRRLHIEWPLNDSVVFRTHTLTEHRGLVEVPVAVFGGLFFDFGRFFLWFFG